MARIVTLLIVAVLAAAPAAGLAAAPADPTQPPTFEQTPSQSQNLVGEEPTQTQAPPRPADLDDTSVGGREALLIGVGIVALIGGIWFFIARDAKRVTAGRVPAADSGSGRSATRASRRSRRLSTAERRRRKRGRATK
jgi:hypothetical protein